MNLWGRVAGAVPTRAADAAPSGAGPYRATNS